MKKLLLLLLFIPLVSCDKKNTLSELNLNGKVESIVISSYEAEEKFGDIEKGELQSIYEEEFNDDGNIVERNWYDEEEELTFKWKFKYDDDGNMIEQKQYDKEGELTSKSKFKYDDDGKIVENKQYDKEGELTDKWKFKYDDDGNMIEVKHTYYYSDTKETTTYEYEYEEYDKKGNWTKRISYQDDKPYQIEEREIEYY